MVMVFIFTPDFIFRSAFNAFPAAAAAVVRGEENETARDAETIFDFILLVHFRLSLKCLPS
jgi:hypothetical protein